MSDMFFKLGPDADSTITLYPEWDYEQGLQKLEKKHRLQNADLYVYKTGEYDEINIKCKFFPLSDAAIVNSWWQSNALLVYYQREKDFRDWTFDSSTDGWASPSSATLAINQTSGILLIETSSNYGDLYLTFENSTFQGSGNYKVNIRLKISDSSSWFGWLYWGSVAANSHSTSNSYFKTISIPSGVYSDFVIAEWDMRSATVGGDDWMNSEISRLHIYLTDQSSPAVNKTDFVDYIDIGFRYSEVTSVMIRNTKKPFAKYQEPYADYMQGTIKLEGY